MKSNLLQWFWTLVEYLMLFPVILIIAGLALPAEYVLIFILTLPLHTLLAIICTAALKKFNNIIVFTIGAVYTLLNVGIWLIAFTLDSRYTLMIILGSALFFLRGVKKATGKELMIFFYTGGLVIHGIALLLINRIPVLNSFFNTAIISSIIYIAATLPLANRYFLIAESQQKNSLSTMPHSVIRGNRIIVAFILALIGLLSIGKYLVLAFNGILKFMAGLVAGLMKLLSTSDSYVQEPVESSAPEPLELPQTESNPFMEIISELISTLIILVILFIILRYLIKNHKQIIKGIIDFFSRMLSRFQKWSSTEKSYTDKQEFLLKTDEQKKTSFLRRLFRREERWKDMKDNASRTRFIYAKFVLDTIKKGFKFRLSDTPKETVERINRETKASEDKHELINEAYNQACYGKKEISDETVRVLKDRYL